MLAFIIWIFSNWCFVNSSIGTYSVTRRDFPFVDASRCRQEEFCGVSPEFDLKFGRPIPATVYCPGNATHFFNISTPMNVLIFAALASVDEFHYILTNIASSGVVVISVQLENKQETFDYVKDLLRVAFDMYYENDEITSIFYQKLSGSTVIVGYGEMADEILWINQVGYYVHSSIKGIISLSPSLWRDQQLMAAARNIEVSVLFIATTTDAWRPISHQRAIYTKVPTGPSEFNGVCKIYIEIVGGNHCFFVDNNNNTECYQKEMEYPSYKIPSLSHQYQLEMYSARILLEYTNFISNPTNHTATLFQQYLINARDTTNDIQYLQSCYVDNILFAHDTYFPPNDETVVYRTIQ